jgi:hypothetical protein
VLSVSPRLVTVALVVGLASSCSCGPIGASGPEGCEATAAALAGAPPPSGPVPTTRELSRADRRDTSPSCPDLTAAVEAEKAGRAGEALDGYARFLRERPGHSLGPVVEARTKALVATAWAPTGAAFEKADCRAVMAARAEVLGRFDDAVTKKVAPEAGFQAGQCKVLEDAAAAEDAQPDQALLAYSSLLPPPGVPGAPGAPGTPGVAAYPLAGAARERAATLVSRVGAAKLAGTTSCAGPSAAVFEKGSETAFAFDLACAEWAEKGAAGSASGRYERLLAEYPGHPRAADVKAGLARSMLAGGSGGSGDLPPPQVAGRTGGGPRITVRNSSNRPLRLVMGGPTTIVEELPPCTGCSPGSFVGTCDSRATSTSYTLPAGSYEVAVRAMEGSVSPYKGTWSIASGTTYEHCLYIQTTFR